MLHKTPFLLVLVLLSSPAFAQGNQPGETGPGYVQCPNGQLYVYLYQNLNNFEVLASPKCGEKIEVVGRETIPAGTYLKVRTPEGQEGYLPQAHFTTTAPPTARVRIPEPPLPAPAGQTTNIPILQPGGEPLDVPRAEIFGGYSYFSMDTSGLSSRTAFHGWNASATYNLNSWFGVEADGSGHYKPNCAGVSGVTCGHLTLMGGPRVAHRTGNVIAFGHGLFGIGNLRASSLGLASSETNLAFAGGGGVELALTERFSARVGQFDYLVTRYGSSSGAPSQKNFRVSAGVVIRLGRVITE